MLDRVSRTNWKRVSAHAASRGLIWLWCGAVCIGPASGAALAMPSTSAAAPARFGGGAIDAKWKLANGDLSVLVDIQGRHRADQLRFQAAGRLARNCVAG